MDSSKFGEDLARKASLVSDLASHDFDWPDLSGLNIFFSGMGSSTFAAGAISNLFNANGINSHTTLASNPNPPQAQTNSAFIAISASGNSIETSLAFDNAKGFKEKLFLTNSLSSSNQKTIYLAAGHEEGGVASLTYVATLISLLKLAEDLGVVTNVRDSILKASDAIDDIYSRRHDWLPVLANDAISEDGTYFVAPQHRISSAHQSALMLREGPRIPADSCETGDWSHVDVYLTKTQDYRLLLFPGSPWESQLFDWCGKRKTKVVTIGFENERAVNAFRYKNDDDEIVRLLTETTYAENLAQYLWRE